MTEGQGLGRSAIGTLVTSALSTANLVQNTKQVQAGVGTNAAAGSGAFADITFGTTSPTLSLEAGTWLIIATIANVGDSTQITVCDVRIRNTTGGATVGVEGSMPMFYDSVGDLPVPSHITLHGTITLASTSAVTLQSGNRTGAGNSIISTKTSIEAIRLY